MQSLIGALYVSIVLGAVSVLAQRASKPRRVEGFCYPRAELKKLNYRDNTNTTVNFYDCQPWNKNVTHPNSNYHKLSEDHNYCRNPDHHKDGPWCYTTDKDVEWESCFPSCEARHCVLAPAFNDELDIPTQRCRVKMVARGRR